MVWASGKKNSGLLIFFHNRVYHLHKSVPLKENYKTAPKPENDIKDEFNRLNTNFRLEHSVRRKNRTDFLDVPFLLPEIFYWNGKKSCVPFTFYPDFPETFFPCSLK